MRRRGSQPVSVSVSYASGRFKQRLRDKSRIGGIEHRGATRIGRR
jgi:hypothetical protein